MEFRPLYKFIFVGLLMITGCDLVEHREMHDPSMKLSAQDYRDVTKPIEDAPASFSEFNVLDETKLPPALTPEMKKPVSITVGDNLLLSEVFMELSRQTGIGLALSSNMKSDKAGVLYSARQQPCIEVIKDLCEMTGHRFEIKGRMIKIEPDSPYLVTYKLESLSNTRVSENRISTTTDVFTVMENTKNRADNGSDSLLTANATSDFWGEFERNLQMILYDPRVKGKDALSPHYTVHKQAGLVTINANAQQHNKVSGYINKLRENIGTQVLIEAKILEVNLSDEFRSGINWNILGNDVKLSAPLGSLSSPGPLDTATGFARDVMTFAVDHKDFASVLRMIKKFGTVRTLSNPRLTVMNNQSAILKVATNEVFFQMEFDRYFQADGKPDVESFSSNIMTVPIGLILVVQPSVNHNTGDITMTLRPTVSRIDKFVEDPAVAIKSGQKVQSKIPVVQVRELDSVLRMKSGQVLIMGGLMEDRSTNTSASVPGVDEVPLLGEFARGKDDDRKVTELVIFLSAKIIRDSYVGEADAKFYNTYAQDPRPLKM